MEVLQRWTSTKHGVKVNGSTKVVTKVKALEKVKVKAKDRVRTLEKDLEIRAKAKTKAKVEVAIGKVEAEVSRGYKGRGRGFKGKGRGFGGFGNYKGKGKGKAQAPTGVCHYCHKYGHFEAQGRQKQRGMGYQARNIDLENPSENASSTGTSTQAPTSVSRNQPSSQSGTQPTNKPVIRMVSMYCMGDQPASFPEEFELSEDSEEIEMEYFGRVLSVQEESVQEFGLEMRVMKKGNQTRTPCTNGTYDEHDQGQYIRMIHVEKTKEIEVVLDSGADISLAPLWMKRYGKRVPEKAKVVLRDAQGSRIKVSDQRVIQVEFEDASGNKVKVEEVFLISSVVHPLLAVGKLLKKGWQFRNGTSTGTFLVEGTTRIPVSYNNNSLTAKAFVRAVNKESVKKPIPVYLCNNLNDIVAEGRVGWTSWRDPFQVHYSTA